MESAGIAISDRLAPYVVKIIGAFQKLVDKFNSLSPKTQDVIIKIALLAATIGPGIAIAGKFVTMYGKLFKTIGKVGKAFDAAGGASKFFNSKLGSMSGGVKKAQGMLSTLGSKMGKAGKLIMSPWGLALGAVGGGLVALYKKNEEFKNGVDGAWKQIKSAMAPSVKAISSEFSKLMHSLGPVIKTIGQSLGKAVGDAAKAMTPMIKSIGPALAKAFKAIGAVVKAVAPIFAKIFTSAIKIVIKIINLVMKVAAKVAPIFSKVFGVVAKVVQAIAPVFEKIFSKIMKVLDGIISFISGVFSGNWSKAWEGVKSIFKGIMETLGTIVKAPLNAIISAMNWVIDGLNKISIDVPDWVPGVGGKHFGINISHIPKLEKGTSSFSGGIAMVGEKGPELVQLPHGSKVNSNKETQKMIGGKTIIIQKFADKLVVREEADIDKIATLLARKLETVEPNMA